MTQSKIWGLALFMLLILTAGLPNRAMAHALLERQSTVIPQNQTVDDVVVVGGDATIAGTLQGSLVVLSGNADIRSTARIRGLVLVIGGNVKQAPGAVVQEQVINLSMDNTFGNSLILGTGIVIALWLLQLAGSLLIVLLAPATVSIGKQRLDPMLQLLKSSPARMLYTGFFGSLILTALTIILVVTVIGIPLALLLLLLVLIAFVLGLSVICLLVGERVRGAEGRAAWIVAIMGAAVVAAFLNIPIVGSFLLLALVWLTLGITITWSWGHWRKRTHSSDTAGRLQND